MKTLIKKENNNITIELGGRLSYEATDYLKNKLNEIAKETPNADILFDLENLDFVGSTGISQFVLSLIEFNQKIAKKPQYKNVKSEFKKIMTAFDNNNTFLFEDGSFNVRKFSRLDN